MFTENPSVPEPPLDKAPKPPQLPDLPAQRQAEKDVVQAEGDADQFVNDAFDLARQAENLASLPPEDAAALASMQDQLESALQAIEAGEKNQ